MRLSFISGCFFLSCSLLSAQDAVYHGGVGDGYASGMKSNETDGLFSGGTGDGYSKSSLELMIGSFGEGGEGDGFALAIKESTATGLFEGAIGDGYDASTFTSADFSAYEGGSGDGYHQSRFIPKLWVGLVSESWDDALNWSDIILPVLSDAVFIIEEAPHYPLLESGVFGINDMNSTLGFCRSLHVAPMAQITFAQDAAFLNHGFFTISGTAIFMGPATSPLNYGLLKVKEGGVMEVLE